MAEITDAGATKAQITDAGATKAQITDDGAQKAQIPDDGAVMVQITDDGAAMVQMMAWNSAGGEKMEVKLRKWVLKFGGKQENPKTEKKRSREPKN